MTMCNDYFGLPSSKSAPKINEMKSFEEDVVRMVSSVEFKHVKDHFLNNIAEDLKKVNSSQNVFVFADKTRNLYETAPDEYNKLVTENITKSYKLGSKILTDDINSKLQKITSKISIGDRIDTMATRNAFVSLKDHKDNFDSHPKCRLINPLMIKAVLLSRLAMTQDSIRNTHTQMLWEKGFRGETLPVLVTKYGQNVIPKTHVTLH